MSDLPILENAYRDFLAEEHELFQWLLENGPSYMRDRIGTDADLPEQTAFPGALAWSLVMNVQRAKAYLGELTPAMFDESSDMQLTGSLGGPGLLEAYYDAYGASAPDNVDAFWMRHLFYANYRRTRHTYHITEGLWEQLEGMEWPEDAPAKALKYLPLPAFGLKAPSGTIYTVCYDLLSGEEGSGELELRVGRLEKNGDINGFTLLHLGDPGRKGESSNGLSIEEGFRRGIQTIADGMESQDGRITTNNRHYTLEEFRDYMYENAKRIVNVLLYLAGEDDIVERTRDYPDKPYKRHRRAVKGTGLEAEIARAPSESDVGVRMQQALDRHRSREEPEQEGSGSSKRPHIRRPHPHLYWTGKGRSIPKIKYLGPIAVESGSEESAGEKSVPPTEQEVQ